MAATAAATLQDADRTIHAGGTTSGPGRHQRAAGEERAAVAVRQGGLSIEAGSHYVATLAVRADTTREVRLRIASAAGDTYATRLFTVGPAWQVLTVDSTVFATRRRTPTSRSTSGGSRSTTWLDDASFGQVAATGG